jgi:hypothetical protein
MAPRRFLPLLFVALSIGAAACGAGDRPAHVAAGGDPAGVTSTTEAAVTSTSALAATTSTVPTLPAPTTTSVPTVAGGTAASPVEGLDAAQLQQAVEAPSPASTRSAAGAMVDQVTLPDGTRVWRVRIPGDFRARSARVAVSVGRRLVGEGVLARDLQSITAVTTDGSGLTAGQPVSYRWEGGSSVAAGNLAVVR